MSITTFGKKPTGPNRRFNPRYGRNQTRINERIRAREVRVVGGDGEQLGVFPVQQAVKMAREQGVDLVEIAPQASPPVCRLIDFGKFKYDQAKKQKETHKHHHGKQVKEIKLSPSIDPHDLNTKLHHAIEFLCDDKKVKLTLRFRGRENAHQEFGFQVIDKFVEGVNRYGTPDAPPKRIGRALNMILSPLPRNKRASDPRADDRVPAGTGGKASSDSKRQMERKDKSDQTTGSKAKEDQEVPVTANSR